MKISIFGLGYVGCVNLGCFAKLGHEVIGVDISTDKVDCVNSGKPTVNEPRLDNLIDEYHKLGKIKATTDQIEAISNTDICLICINTPNDIDGLLDIRHIETLYEPLSASLIEKDKFLFIIIRSTVMPGTCKEVSAIIEQKSGKREGIDFSVVNMPEFLREGSAVTDFFDPPYTIVGTDCNKNKEIFIELLEGVKNETYFIDTKSSEMLKLVNNNFHALKIAFANEIGYLCKKKGINSYQLMDLLCRDKKLNISNHYLKPGFAYGGSCLSKDLLATVSLARNMFFRLPLLESISKSNRNTIDMLLKEIKEISPNKIGIIGLSFKKDTDDLRESPIIYVIKDLLKLDITVEIYERFNTTALFGKNREFIDNYLPNIEKLVNDDVDDLILGADLLIAFNDNKFVEKCLKDHPDKIVIDLTVNRLDGIKSPNYKGLTW